MNQFRWMGVLACLLINFLATTATADPPGIAWSLPEDAFEQKPPLDRSIHSIQLNGLETIPAEMVREDLACNLDVLEAQHSSIDDRRFRQVVASELARGFEHCGYLEHELTCETETSDDGTVDHLQFEITEGPRYRRGEITIRFESNRQDEPANQMLTRVEDHLLASTFMDDKTEKPVWQTGDIAWYGHRSTWEIISRIRDAIRPISDQADSVDVQTQLDSAAHRVRLVVTLPDDFDWKQISGQVTAADEIDAANPIAMELRQLHRDHFQVVMPGYEIETKIDNHRLKYATMDDEACLEMVHLDGRHIASVWMRPNRLWTSFESGGQAVWDVPVRNGSLIISVTEDATNKDEFRLNFTMNAAFNRKKHVQPDPNGFRIDANVWQKLFSATTEKEIRGNVVVYRNGENEIRCDAQGVPQHLTLVRSPTNRVTIDRIGDTYFRDLTARLFPSDANRGWVIRPDQDDPAKVQTLASFLYGDALLNENMAGEVKSESDEGKAYWIPPRYGSVDTLGHVALRMVRELKLVQQDDPLDPLLKLAVLTNSKRFATVPERLDEAIANDGGAISDVAFACFAIEAKCYGRAKELLDRSRVDSANIAKVQHNVRRWLDRDSMLGQILSQTDVRAICDYVLNHFDVESTWVAAAGKLGEYLPTAATDDERYENAINTFSFAWISMHTKILDPLSAQVDAKLDAEKKKADKVAEKKKADKDKKAKKR